jgi:GNAT superfamily N-acetyltransferase
MAIAGRTEVPVALAVGLHGERRNRYPGHREVDRTTAVQEAVAKDRHHVRHRRQSEVAIERACERRGVAAGRRKVEPAFMIGGDAPDAAGVAAEIEVAAPTLAARDDVKPRGHEAGHGLELVVEPVGNRRTADGHAGCSQLIATGLDLGELDAERVVHDPGSRPPLLVQDPDTPYMLHCHLLLHEDLGMMGQFTVVERGQSLKARQHQLHPCITTGDRLMSDVVPPARIRRAAADEGERLRKIAVAAKGYWGYDEERLRAWGASLDFSPGALEGKELYVAEVGRVVVGWTSLVSRGEVSWLDDLWIEPASIRTGVGSQLFRHAAERAVALGARRLEWEAEPNALGFYERMGGRYLREGEPSEWGGRILAVMGIELA